MNAPFGMRREAGFYYLAFLIYVNLCWLIRGSLFGVLLAHSVLLRFPFLLMFNEFIRCFHQFVSQIVSTNYFHEFFSIWAVEKENNFLLVQNSFFFQFASYEYSLKKFVDSDFKIGETIWWMRYLIFFFLILQGWGVKLYLWFCHWENWRNRLFTNVALFGVNDRCLWHYDPKAQFIYYDSNALSFYGSKIILDCPNHFGRVPIVLYRSN
jgi:hypothetical protein